MVSIEIPPKRLGKPYAFLFTDGALHFLKEFVETFEHDYNNLMVQRKKRAVEISENKFIPQFKYNSTRPNWTIGSLPPRLRNRKLDLGDCSPSNTISFIDALNENVQGIQVYIYTL